MSYKPWSKEETELIKTHYLTAPKAELLRLLPRRTWQDITQKAYKIGITGRSFQFDPLRGNAAKYTINIDFFAEWSQDLAYVLGYVIGDGNVDELLTRLTIVSKDKDHLERINTAIGSNRPLYQRALDDTYYEGAKQTWSLIVTSTAVVHHLLRLSIEPNKSISGSYPLVPKEFWWHFFRGILDSDGNIFFSPKAGLRVTIAGNRKCIMGLQSDLSHLFSIDSQTKHLDEDRVKLLFLYGENAERALMLTYQSSDGLRLERKYIQWLEWNQYFKLMTNCLLCDAPLRASKGEKLCPSCRIIRTRLMNRRSDHHRRKGTWLSLRELCKPEESHLPVEHLDRYIE
jgi:hypothetical protein